MAEGKENDFDLEDFEKGCKDVSRKISQRGKLAFLVMVDGSKQSDVAFEAILNLRRKYDHIGVFHAYNDEPEKQPPSFRPSHIKAKYENELIPLVPEGRYSLHWEDRKGRPVMDVLKQALSPFREHAEPLLPNGMEADFVVFGHHGRKGAKSAPTTLGSNAELALRSLVHPTMIIKTPCRRGLKTFLYAVNASEISKSGLDVLLNLVSPKDTVNVIMMLGYDDDRSELHALEQYYKNELEAHGPVDSSFAFVDKDRGKIVSRALVDYVNEAGPDFLVLSPRAKHRLSSVTEYVVNHADCSVILCKH